MRTGDGRDGHVSGSWPEAALSMRGGGADIGRIIIDLRRVLLLADRPTDGVFVYDARPQSESVR